MSVLPLLAANKFFFALGGVGTATVAATTIPMALSNTSESVDVIRGDNDSINTSVSSIGKSVSMEQKVEGEKVVVLEPKQVAPVRAKSVEDTADIDDFLVEDSVYNDAVNKASDLFRKASDYKSELDLLTRQFPVWLRDKGNRFSKCWAKNYPDQLKVHNFYEAFSAYTATKEDAVALGKIISSLSGGGNLFNKQIEAKNKNKHVFEEFSAGLTKLEEEYSSIEGRRPAYDFAKKFGAAVSTLDNDLSVCDLKDVIRLNDEIGRQHNFGN